MGENYDDKSVALPESRDSRRTQRPGLFERGGGGRCLRNSGQSLSCLDPTTEQVNVILWKTSKEQPSTNRFLCCVFRVRQKQTSKFQQQESQLSRTRKQLSTCQPAFPQRLVMLRYAEVPNIILSSTFPMEVPTMMSSVSLSISSSVPHLTPPSILPITSQGNLVYNYL